MPGLNLGQMCSGQMHITCCAFSSASTTEYLLTLPHGSEWKLQIPTSPPHECEFLSPVCFASQRPRRAPSESGGAPPAPVCSPAPRPGSAPGCPFPPRYSESAAPASRGRVGTLEVWRARDTWGALGVWGAEGAWDHGEHLEPRECGKAWSAQGARRVWGWGIIREQGARSLPGGR